MSSKKIPYGLVGGLLSGFILALSLAWGLATKAAESVISPINTELVRHKESAKARVHIMCEWARVQNENTAAICEQVGAKCERLGAEVLVEGGCKEPE